MAESSCRDMSNRKTKTFESIIKIKWQVTPSFADSSGLTQPCYKSISSREGDTTIGHQDWADSLMKVALNTCISLFSVVPRRKFQNNKQLTLTNCVRLTILNYQQLLCQVCAWFELGLSTAFSFSKRLESALCDFVYKAICILCISVLLTIFQFLCYRHSTCSYWLRSVSISLIHSHNYHTSSFKAVARLKMYGGHLPFLPVICYEAASNHGTVLKKLLFNEFQSKI